MARDALDVFMSWWNFYHDFTPQVIAAFNSTPGRVEPELLLCPDDIHELWHGWMTLGVRAGDGGLSIWSVLRHVQSWWGYRHLPNIMLVHYADLLKDVEGRGSANHIVS